MREQKIAIIAFTLWLIIVFVLMLLARWVDLTSFFIISLLWFLIIMMQLQSSNVQLTYQNYMWFLIIAGVMIFSLIVAQKVFEILGLEIIFR
jgi:hypothetical protein